jgi:hypothetical protein
LKECNPFFQILSFPLSGGRKIKRENYVVRRQGRGDEIFIFLKDQHEYTRIERMNTNQFCLNHLSTITTTSTHP